MAATSTSPFFAVIPKRKHRALSSESAPICDSGTLKFTRTRFSFLTTLSTIFPGEGFGLLRGKASFETTVDLAGEALRCATTDAFSGAIDEEATEGLLFGSDIFFAFAKYGLS